MKIKKIQMIEEPRKVLNPSQMNGLVGGSGTVCYSYEDGYIHDSCGTYQPNKPCDGSTSGVLCYSYAW